MYLASVFAWAAWHDATPSSTRLRHRQFKKSYHFPSDPRPYSQNHGGPIAVMCPQHRHHWHQLQASISNQGQPEPRSRGLLLVNDSHQETLASFSKNPTKYSLASVEVKTHELSMQTHAVISCRRLNASSRFAGKAGRGT
ncbi:hypothetical protein F5Y12DRAFT_719885 [Xylaria sp. FL1777]|nr:hypothetical protein F5Y12DRAFT_719885 [Xylaria sp. FL1777]